MVSSVFQITGTLIWYYYVCQREVWLMGHGIHPFDDDPFMEIGRIIHEEYYQREKKEVETCGMKFDIIKRGDKGLIIAEVKKSSRFIKPATMQLTFYLYTLRKQGIDAEGELLIPRERKRIKVNLTDELKIELESAIMRVKEIMEKDKPPPPNRIPFCRHCAYIEFCWA